MPHFEATRTVPYTARQMFDLVADVEAYPEFVPLCRDLEITSREPADEGREIITADMTVAYKLFSERFKSKVLLDRAAGTILVEYLAGPLSQLENRWRFTDHDRGCDVAFTIDYEFSSRAFKMLMGAVFERAFSRFADAFEARARVVYGRGTAQASNG